MMNWITYGTDQGHIESDNIISMYIIQELGSILKLFYSYSDKIRPQRTTLIVDTLSLLGDRESPNKPKYKVYSHSLSPYLRQSQGGKFKNVEWLYDLHWYTEENEPFMPKTLPLVVECEWNRRKKGVKGIPFSGFKYDFQKLLVANADLRLMIFIVNRKLELEYLDTYFDKAIRNYVSLAKGSRFLFVAFDESIKGFHYSEKEK